MHLQSNKGSQVRNVINYLISSSQAVLTRDRRLHRRANNLLKCILSTFLDRRETDCFAIIYANQQITVCNERSAMFTKNLIKIVDAACLRNGLLLALVT